MRSIKWFLTSVIIISLAIACKTQQIPKSDIHLIKEVLTAQETAWNEGDIDAFMEGYWKHEKLTFVGKSGITHGWQQTLDNYKKGYPDVAAMGKLQFEILETRSISDDAYLMHGRYTLYREADQPTGIFSLVWQKIDDRWVITSDHTSG